MMTYTTAQINRDFRMKVDGMTEEGKKLHTLMGCAGILNLIGEEFFEKFLNRAYACMDDKCCCKLRRGIVITFYAK